MNGSDLCIQYFECTYYYKKQANNQQWLQHCIEGQQQESRKLCCPTEPKFKVPEECKIQGKGEKESDRDKETEPEERENHVL